MQKKVDKFCEMRSVQSPGQSRTGLAKEILEFEQMARKMMSRMDVTLMTINGIVNEKDPSRRLEVNRILAFLLQCDPRKGTKNSKKWIFGL